MSRDDSDKHTGGRASVEGEALYVYCVGARTDLAPLFADAAALPPAIEETSSLALVEADDLAAVVSAVSLADYGEESLQERMSVPAWTAARAMRHEHAVEHFARRASVVPLRFGTIYLTRERVARMLEERHDELASLIARLRGREEWGVNVYADRARMKEAVINVSPRLREMNERAASSPPGQAYLLRKKIEAMRADEARDATRRVAQEVEEGLARVSDASARLRVHKDETGEHGGVAAKLAFLVERERFEEFRDAAEAFAREYEPLGVRLELTGPWPAYNFAA